MAKRVGIKEAAELVGLSEYALRAGIRAGKYPHIRVGTGGGRILFDVEMLERYLEQEAASSVRQLEGVIQYSQLRRVAP